MSLLAPGLRHHIVNVRIFILVSIRVHLVVSEQECSLVESVLLRHVAWLGDLVLLRVEDVGTCRGVTLFFAAEDQNLSMRDGTGTEPVLDIVLERLRPHLDQLPIRLISRLSIQSLYICDRWFVASEHVDVPISNSDCSWKVAIPIQVRLLPPLVALNIVDFTSLRSVVESRAYRINVAWPDCG